MNGVMVSQDTLRSEKKAESLRLSETHGGHTIRVFGSVARGDNGESSDVDFLVEFENDLIGLKLDLRTCSALFGIAAKSCYSVFPGDR
jgi:predicted nucleotidyltransferase